MTGLPPLEDSFWPHKASDVHAHAAPRKLDSLERLDPVECVAEVVLLDLKVEAGLEVEPEPVGGAEVASQPERCVGSDPTLAVHDLVDPTWGHADRDGEPVLADLQRLQEFRLFTDKSG